MICLNLSAFKMYLNLNFQLFKYQSDKMIISFFKTLHYRYSGFNVFKVITCNVSNFPVIKLCLWSVKTQVSVSYLTNIVSLLQFCTLNLCFLNVTWNYKQCRKKSAICTFTRKPYFIKIKHFIRTVACRLTCQFLHTLWQDNLLDNFCISTCFILFPPLLYSTGGNTLRAYILEGLILTFFTYIWGNFIFFTVSYLIY